MKFETKEFSKKSFVPFKVEIIFENEREYRAIKNVLGKFRDDLITKDYSIRKEVSRESIDIFCNEIDFMYELYAAITKNED